MSAEAERNAFEAWMSEGGKWPKAVHRGVDGSYKLAQTASAWTTWQARAGLVLPESAPAPVPAVGDRDRPSTEWYRDKINSIDDSGITAGASSTEPLVAAEVPADERAVLADECKERADLLRLEFQHATESIRHTVNLLERCAEALASAVPQAAGEPGALREAFLELYAASEPEWDADDDTGRSASCQGYYVPAPAMSDFAEALGFKSDAEIDRAIAAADQRAEP